ncbi:hypothetical protein PG985_011825 [Apiospora marii]|uniref:uncharacterized protein n=1 Tax=Apiospora marii TaxID=335849 RepID=UPI0031314E64
MTEATNSSSIRASMAFLRDLKLYEVEKPYHLTLSKDREADSILTNIVHDVYDNIKVTNVRDQEDAFRLDVQGFQLERHETSLSTEDFNKSQARERYSNEIANLLKGCLGAQEVRLMHYMVRDRSLAKMQESGAARGRPIPGVHIDASYEGASSRIQQHWPGEAAELQKRRFQIVNVWRPLTPELRSWPLALCDVRSVAARDLVLADQILPGYQGENTLVLFNPGHKFYYVDGQRQDEVWLFKQFDSLDSVAGDAELGDDAVK